MRVWVLWGKETLNSKMASHAGGEEQNVKGRCGTKYVRRGQSLVLCLFLLFRCIPPCSVQNWSCRSLLSLSKLRLSCVLPGHIWLCLGIPSLKLTPEGHDFILSLHNKCYNTFQTVVEYTATIPPSSICNSAQK